MSIARYKKDDAIMEATKDTKKDTKNITNIETTEKYWDCECKDDYIHPKSQIVCLRCNTVAGEQPDSRVDEVLVQGLHL